VGSTCLGKCVLRREPPVASFDPTQLAAPPLLRVCGRPPLLPSLSVCKQTHAHRTSVVSSGMPPTYSLRAFFASCGFDAAICACTLAIHARRCASLRSSCAGVGGPCGGSDVFADAAAFALLAAGSCCSGASPHGACASAPAAAAV